MSLHLLLLKSSMAKVCTDPSDLHADGDDDEEVEGSRPDDGSGAQISGLELAPDDLDHREQDLWSWKE